MSYTSPLFPQFLDKDSDGIAVAILHAFLLAQGYEINLEEITGRYYGESTATSLKSYQVDKLDFEGADADGNLGPKTRRRITKVTGFDFDKIPVSLFLGETTRAKFPQQEDRVTWPPEGVVE